MIADLTFDQQLMYAEGDDEEETSGVPQSGPRHPRTGKPYTTFRDVQEYQKFMRGER